MLYFEKKGNGKKTLVLLHGFMENTTIWDEMETTISSHFTLLKIDFPGHGKSDFDNREILHMDDLANMVKEVIDYNSLEKVNILGHSMGGYVALAFAEKFPKYIDSLTLFFSTYLADDAEKKEQRAKSFRIILDAFPHYVKAGIPNLFDSNELENLKDQIQLATQIALTTNNKAALACVKGMIERPCRKFVLENLNANILLIAGKQDNAVKTQNTLNDLPMKKNIKSYLLHCGHNGHWEKPEICAAIINSEI